MVQFDRMQVSLNAMYASSVHKQAKSLGSHDELGSAVAMHVVCCGYRQSIVTRFVVSYTVIHTAHVGSWFSSRKSSLAAAAAVSESFAPAVCANAVRAEESRQRIAVKCIMESGRSYFAM
jgi:hypothetical protein